MTKRRRKKIIKIMYTSTYKYVSKGKFDYLFRQTKLFRKHETYLDKMCKRDWKKVTEKLLEKYGGKKVNG